MSSTGGAVPMLDDLVEQFPEMVSVSSFDKSRLLNTFEIIPLPECIFREGVGHTSYVVVVKKPPHYGDWSIVFVNGKEVSVE